MSMDKRQFLEQVITEVRALPLSQVVEMHLPLTRRGVKNMALCPFHNDKSMGSFVVTDGKNIYKCFSCGEGGDAIKFHASMEGLSYVESAFRLARIFMLITEDDFEEYFSRRRYSEKEIRTIERQYQELDKDKLKNDIADDATLHDVFTLFLEHLTLSEEHKKHLMESRNLTEEDIEERGYKSFEGRRKIKEVVEAIKEKYGVEVLKKIPGFFEEEKRNSKTGELFWAWTFAKYDGIIIPIRNVSGQITGLQIRRDGDNHAGGRYVWFSSSFANFKDKCRNGTSSGSPIDVVKPKKVNKQIRWVFITEGRFKAEAIAKKWGVTAISVQGVGSWKGMPDVLKQAIKTPVTADDAVMIAFDADINHKPQVWKQAKKMTNEIEYEGYPVYYLNWDDSFGKGIDDLISVGEEAKIKRYAKKKWDDAYQKVIEIAMKECDVMRLDDLTEDEFREYYQKYMRATPMARGEISAFHTSLLETDLRKRG